MTRLYVCARRLSNTVNLVNWITGETKRTRRIHRRSNVVVVVVDVVIVSIRGTSMPLDMARARQVAFLLANWSSSLDHCSLLLLLHRFVSSLLTRRLINGWWLCEGNRHTHTHKKTIHPSRPFVRPVLERNDATADDSLRMNIFQQKAHIIARLNKHRRERARSRVHVDLMRSNQKHLHLHYR